MDFEFTDDINIVPVAQQSKRCEWYNYVPNKTPKYSNKEVWSQYYMDEIEDMYDIVYNIIEDNFPGQTDWSRPAIFTNLITVLYHCSSKHIDT